MNIRSLTETNVAGKRVLMRAGFDVPLENGKVVDTRRLEAVAPSMKWILEHGGRLILLAHQGRPKGKPVAEFSQRPLVAPLEKILGVTVAFSDTIIGPEAEAMAAAVPNGGALLIENLRFDPREEQDDPEFAAGLAKLGDIYVNDAFTNCHRAHASVSALAKLLPAYGGLNLLEEVSHLAPVLENPRRPLTLIISGAKMETKVPVIRRFLALADDIIVGGAIANTFLAAQGLNVGASLCEADQVPVAKAILAEKSRANIHLPDDVVVASDDTKDTAMAGDLPVNAVSDGMVISDIGHATATRNAAILSGSQLVIWNGPLGRYEIEAFAGGSLSLVEALAAATTHGATSIVGGGDTLDLHERYGKSLSAYSFVSTAGGAMLEFLAGNDLPGLAVLATPTR